MLSGNEFVRQSLETHLFFARIMKEHSFFLQIGFTPRDANYSHQADYLRMEFDKLLWEVVCLSNDFISKDVIESEEIVTPYTLKAENASSCFTGVDIPTYITEAEMELKGGDCGTVDPVFEHTVCMLNERSLGLITAIIDFKSNVLENVLSCNMFTVNYPSLIKHILEEAELYQSTITKIQRREKIDMQKEMYEQELLWNKAMEGHSEFISGLLDPSEKDLINISNDFADEFNELGEEVKEAMEKCLPLDEITDKSLEATKRISEFNQEATEGLLECDIKSIIIPLLGDHVLRESNHFIRLLKSFQKID